MTKFTADAVHDVVILGSGPAGLTAALYAARANLHPVCIAGIEAGGQLMITTEVENYPGFPEAIMGPDLVAAFRKQAERFGTHFIADEATSLDLSSRPFKTTAGDTTFHSRSVIVATGASPRRLALESERRLTGRGVSTCATCDGAFFSGQELVVVGGGDSAMEEALFLTRFATKVTVVHRRDKLRASQIMQERAFGHPLIQFVWNSAVTDVLGDATVSGVHIKDLNTGSESQLPCSGVFVAIGHIPNTGIVEGQLLLNQGGYILTGESLRERGYVAAGDARLRATATSVEGAFAAGDNYDFVYRQAVTAAAMGCMAAIDCERWLESHGR